LTSWGFKTPAYEDAFRKGKLRLRSISGEPAKKQPAAKNMYRYTAMGRKVDKLIERAILFFIIFAIFV
jgi:hypothetical protein